MAAFGANTVPLCGSCTPSASGKPNLGALLDVYPIDMTMHAENRGRLAERFSSDALVGKRCLLLFQGGSQLQRHETDHEPLFRQESTFAYLFGVKEGDCYAVIEVDSGRAILFVTRLPESYAVWMGKVRSTESFRSEYKVDEVRYVDELAAFVKEYDPSVIYTSRGYNVDGGQYAREASFDGIEAHRVDNGKLYDEVVACRVIKSERELALLRHVNRISSEAHMWVMANACPGMAEFQLESMFDHWGYFRGGCRHHSYASVCGSGANGSVLHYTSDITCTFPANGVFSADQRAIYEAVLATQWGVMRAMKPGVSYIDMHTLAYRIICEKLREIGILRGDIDEMMEANVASVFMPVEWRPPASTGWVHPVRLSATGLGWFTGWPHGLGHFMGCDTHDVGGRPKGHPKQSRAGYSSLRCCRVLEQGPVVFLHSTKIASDHVTSSFLLSHMRRMVLTVEPGVYFNDFSLDCALGNLETARFIDAEVLARFRGFGGVRIEDDVIVTADGIEDMTRCPRTVADVEAVMSGRINRLDQLHCPFTPAKE